MITFGILGPLRVEHGDTVARTPKAPKVRQLLALLLFLANQVVSTDLIIDELWGTNPPRKAVLTVQTYICHIRKIIAPTADSRGGKEILATVSPGYLLSVRSGQLDTTQFNELVDSGRAMYEQGKPQQATVLLRQALALFRGPVLVDVDTGQVLQPYKVRFEEDRASALALRIQADLALGRHRELIGELKSLTASHPLDEWAHARLMEALSGAGRRSEALDTYQHLRKVLDRELGIAPSPELQRLQHQILRDGQPDH